MAELAEAAADESASQNLMVATIAAARAGATTGEWAGALRDVFGSYRAPTGVGEAAAAPPDADLSELREQVMHLQEKLGRRPKILVGKPGLDGHSNGAEQIAVRARDSGMDVVYEGIRLTPAQIAASALQEGVHVIGLSILSGSHRELIPAVIDALREAGVDAPVVVGGIIPEQDVAALREAGVAAVYTPKDFDITRIMRDIVALVGADGRSGRRRRRGRQRLGVSGARARRVDARQRGCASGDLSAAPAALNLLESTHRRATGQQPPRCWQRSPPRRSAARRRGTWSASPGRPAPASRRCSRRCCAAGARGVAAVAMLAVDPSSRRSGGSLLGDRARIEFDPADRDVFIRSTAAGERLGGLAWATRAAAHALAAAFDIVVIETVGVGQAETEVADVADTVAVVVQPGSGDVLQFLKSGIMEIPDVLVVTKADLGRIAMRTRRDLQRRAALARRRRRRRSSAVSSLPPPTGIDELVAALERTPRQARRRRAAPARAPANALADYAHEHGEAGLRALGGRHAAEQLLAAQDATLDTAALVAALEHGAQSR